MTMTQMSSNAVTTAANASLRPNASACKRVRPLLAMIATGIHGGRKRLGMTEHAREQRNRHTAEHTHAAERASRHARTAACLRVRRLLHLGGKLRHKAQRDTHNHAELMRREPHARNGASRRSSPR